jgi:uncharacterized protein involved in exopolysaccharide biosynthesis/Mrp family chromosome partitioning ATPase
MSLDDVLYTLFRHKWLILGFFCLGIAAAMAVCLVRPPVYVSKAKLMVQYVMESRPVNASDPESQNVQKIDPGVQGIIASEIEILTSLDVAEQTVAEVGAAKVLAKKGGGDDPLAAAGVIASGIEVDPPRTPVITISFKHPDEKMVQPVLGSLIQHYMHKHVAVRQGIGVLDVYYSKQAVELRQKLQQTEEELKRLKKEANVLFLDDTKHSFQAELTKTHAELLDAERELAEHKAVLGNLASEIGSETNSTTGGPSSVRPALLAEYGDLVTEIDRLKKDERDLLRLYTAAYPSVQRVKAQIEKLTKQKSEIERTNPALAYVSLSTSRSGTNSAGGDIASELAEIRRFSARVSALANILSNIQNQASEVLEAEPKIAEAQRRRDEEQKRYDFAMQSLEATHRGQSEHAGTANNISIVQSPTPASLDSKKLMKLLGAVFVGCFGAGLVLAFALDFVVDRSIKRPVDVERHLRLPVFLTIPDTTWSTGLSLPWTSNERDGGGAQLAQTAVENGCTDVAIWDPESPLRPYSEGLRERLMTYFEVRNMNLKKPKLVGVTACNKGAGVSTLASGLAAELSKTGDGNVLLVDVNGDEGMAHPFHRGKPGCGLSDALEPEARAEAQVERNLFVASMMNGQTPSLSPVVPTRFSQMVPKMKASDYDYIIFDMPPVSAISTTPRLASHMDLVLLVLESEQTGQQLAARANTLMGESRANVAAVLNKFRSHVPAPLSQEG